MTIDQTLENGKLTLALNGRLDTAASPLLQETMIPMFGEVEQIELDFTRLDFVSSAGLCVLLMGLKAAKEKETSLTVSHVSEEIMEVFDMTGFSEMLVFV